MIEPLKKSEMIMPYVVGEKINEIIEAFNTHYHKQYEHGLEDYDKGADTSAPRLLNK